MTEDGAEVILPRRALAQPSPHRVAVGDCGACALGGLMGVTVDQAYDLVRDDGPRSVGWPEMSAALRTAASRGRLSRVLVEVPIWPHAVPSMCLTWGLSAPWQSHAWWAYAATAMDAGLYGLACVRFDGAGADSGGPDHWVLIAGYRTRREPSGPDSSRIRDELLVSCSARHPDGRWVERGEFLRRWGGFNALWARPA